MDLVPMNGREKDVSEGSTMSDAESKKSETSFVKRTDAVQFLIYVLAEISFKKFPAISYETVIMMNLISLDINYLNPAFHSNCYQV